MTSARRLTPSMSQLLAFEASARHQSYSRAAEELSLTQSAVGRQIQQLEQRLGVKLFRRAGRNVELTDVGAVYAQEVAMALRRIRNATLQAISFRAGEGDLHLAVLPTLGAKWLLPRLHGFYIEHPRERIHIHSRIGQFDLDLAGIDAAITVGDGFWPGMVTHQLLDDESIPVASPRLLAAHEITAARDILEFPLLLIATRLNAWSEWAVQNGFPSRVLRSGPQFELTSHMLQAVGEGLGVALVSRCLVEEELRSGALVQLPGPTLQTGLAYWLVYPPQKAALPSLVAFRKWLLGHHRERSRTNGGA